MLPRNQLPLRPMLRLSRRPPQQLEQAAGPMTSSWGRARSTWLLDSGCERAREEAGRALTEEKREPAWPTARSARSRINLKGAHYSRAST
jgi:hypothetical protein